MRVDVGQAETDLTELLAAVEAGEEVEIALRRAVEAARTSPGAPSSSCP